MAFTAVTPAASGSHQLRTGAPVKNGMTRFPTAHPTTAVAAATSPLPSTASASTAARKARAASGPLSPSW